MKANAPKRKVFQDAMDLLAEDPVKDTPVAVNGIVSIPVEEIQPFHDHPFRLYEGDRLEDMVQSIREYGVLNPVIVRKIARGYEMLAGHNRTNAAKIAGLTEVPAIVKTDLSDEDAYVYVIETNLLQRSFAELLPSEKAAVLVARYEKISSQGKRNDIRQEIEALEETCGHDVHKSRQRTCGHDVHKLQKSRDGLGKECRIHSSHDEAWLLSVYGGCRTHRFYEYGKHHNHEYYDKKAGIWCITGCGYDK